MNERISDNLNFPSKFVDVLGSKMHYVEAGSGDPILFLHGIPTSCYLWRNIIPHLSPLGHCIALDLIGFGQSDKPDIDYSITDHIKYVEKFIETLKLKQLTIIMHGWGAVIGCHYAMNHPKNCKALVFYEAFLRSENGNDISLPFQEQLLSLEPSNVTDLVTNGASFVDKILPQNAMRTLTDEEMQHYRQPFANSGSGQPLVQYLKELPRGDSKSKADAIIAEYSKKLTQSNIPKLLLYSVPGFITTIATVMWAKEHFPNLEVVDIGEELHLAQESSPSLIGETISAWLQSVEQNA